MFHRACLPLLFALAIAGAACSGDTISFDGERAVDAAATVIEVDVSVDVAEPEPTGIEPTVPEATVADEPTAVPAEPTATVEVVEAASAEATPAEPEPVASGFDEPTVEAALQLLESPGGMAYMGDERDCMRSALLGSDPDDPMIDTRVLNCLDDDGVHRWVSAQLGAIGRSERSIIDRTESACVWEQSGGQIFGINASSSPAIQRCGVWGRVNVGGIDAFSTETLTCLDTQMQTTRLPDGTDRTAVDERIEQCASPDELAFWNSL